MQFLQDINISDEHFELTLTESSGTQYNISNSPISQFSSEVIYHLDPVYLQVTTNSVSNTSVSLSCGLTEEDNVTHSIEAIENQQIPNFVELDDGDEVLTVVAPEVTENESYTFCVTGTDVGASYVFEKIVYLDVVPCTVSDCEICEAFDQQKCQKCADGFLVSKDGTTCEIDDAISPEVQTLIYASIAGVSTNAVILGVVSVLNLSSPQGIWLVLNQFQLYYLLLITGAFIPKDVKDYLSGFELATFSLSFIPTDFPLAVKHAKSWFDYPVSRMDLEDVEIKSGSTFVNIVPLLYGYLCVLTIHGFYWIIYLLTKDAINYREMPKCFGSMTKFFNLSVYIRIFLESYQYVIICCIAEINYFGLYETNEVASLLIALCVFCVLMCFFILTMYQYIKSKARFHKMKYFVQLFSGLSQKHSSKLYPVLILLRRQALVAIFLFHYLNSENLKLLKIGFLVVIQALYLVSMVIMRPFEAKKENLIQCISEVVYFVLCCIQAYFNEEHRWNSTMETICINIIMSNIYIITIISVTSLVHSIIRKYKAKRNANLEQTRLQNDPTVLDASFVNQNSSVKIQPKATNKVKKRKIKTKIKKTKKLKKRNFKKVKQIYLREEAKL